MKAKPATLAAVAVLTLLGGCQNVERHDNIPDAATVQPIDTVPADNTRHYLTDTIQDAPGGVVVPRTRSTP